VAAQTSSPDKRAFFTHMLGEYAVVQVHFSGLQDEVRMPDSKKKECVILEYGWNMPIPIPDLLPNAHGIFATLSFSGTKFQTFVPWSAVFAIADKDSGKGIVWPSEMPPSLLNQDAAPAPAARPSHLRLVK
jgi:stringent starvation protein B